MVIKMKDVKLTTIKKMESLLETASDSTRLKIMLALLDDDECECEECNCGVCESLNCMIEKCVNDIAMEIGASQSLVSHQLYYSLKDRHIRLLLGVAYEHVMEGEEND